MPQLDRRITVNLYLNAMTNEFGEYEQGPATPLNMWARQSDGGSAEVSSGGGTLVTTSKRWQIRFNEQILTTSVALMEVVDSDGFTWDIERSVESDERRRYLEIEGIREVT